MDSDTFRSVLGRFASGVTVLTTRDAEGNDRGMTVSAFCSVSLEPPLVLACIDRSAEMFPLLAPGLHVVFNVLSSPQEALSRRFSELEGSRRFEGIGFSRDVRGIPVLDDVLAWLQCEITAACEGGDHGIFIARVDDAAWEESRPLLYYRGGYAQLER
ncbi:MAG TPA: flavin reductase family protein [Gemmatimonadaceae bacterium]|nr:flavin reductase family protein [Gemmatimonadaceae bacterium]